MPINVVILAAGQGKRMQSDLPKVLHRVGDRPLLAHVLATARIVAGEAAETAARICVVHGHGGEKVREAFPSDDVLWVCQEPQLGTGHALLMALPHLRPAYPTLVLYGDVPLIGVDTLKRLIDVAQRTPGSLAILTATVADPYGYGRIVRSETGAIQSIVEEKDASVAQRAILEVNSGIMVVPTGRLDRWLRALGQSNAQGEHYLTDIIAMAVAEDVAIGSVQAHRVWEIEGVNSKAQLAALERIYQANGATRLMDAGVSLADPARLDVRGTLSCGRDVFVDINCLFEGKVALGDRVTIGPNCVIKDCAIGADTHVAAYSHVDGVTIGDSCRIGPFARLRPGTALGSDVHIGNFVEVKNSRVADRSKANHLAYVGDAIVGSRVNIGAGTITCNYDGVQKHRTVIEDDAFIGSDTQLVAPVTVGRGATLGAGTTLTRDAPAETLTVSRAKQVSLAGWKRPQKKR